MQGRAVDEYRAPLFFAWQLSNRCAARCVTCCEESGPDKAWRDELTRGEALAIARRICDSGIPYVAFGGGEPLGAPHCWSLFDVLSEAGVALKLETDGSLIDDAAADRLAALSFQCIQVSIDGATASTHEQVRPGSSFTRAVSAIERLAARGLSPQLVFAPTRFNIQEIVAAYDLAASLGCGAFVTGPLMRIGRAAAAWDSIACSESDWRNAVIALRDHARAQNGGPELSIYPWDILTEMQKRIESPQAMLLMVPNGKIKLLNALPFAPADLRRDSIEAAWDAYRSAWRQPEVRAFIAECRVDPRLLQHANETWPISSRAR